MGDIEVPASPADFSDPEDDDSMVYTSAKAFKKNKKRKKIEHKEEDIDMYDEDHKLLDERYKKPKKKRGWCKCLLLFLGLCLTTAALVQLSSAYGNWIEKHVFPPTLSAAIRACNDKVEQSYEVSHKYLENHTHVLTVEKPQAPFVLALHNASWNWVNDKLFVQGVCIDVMVFSI
ncbi:hypothetical protein OAU26_03770 [Mariniblastus sp.]|jgi:hypothetical protein|nr:hypothetical protein [Mariniblastus sp.]